MNFVQLCCSEYSMGYSNMHIKEGGGANRTVKLVVIVMQLHEVVVEVDVGGGGASTFYSARANARSFSIDSFSRQEPHVHLCSKFSLVQVCSFELRRFLFAMSHFLLSAP